MRHHRAHPETQFAPIATSLRAAVIDFYAARGGDLSDEAGRATLETNSTLAERRAGLLCDIYRRRSGRESLEGMRVIDMGCGFGALSLYCAARGGEVVGVDSYEPRLRVGRAVAERHGLAARFVVGQMEALEFSDSEFDLAIQNNSLCYVVPREDRRKVLDETRRVLRRGSWLVTRNPNRWTPKDQFTGIPLIHLLPPDRTLRIARARGHERSHVRIPSPLEARRELQTAGFVKIARHAEPNKGWARRHLPFGNYQHFSAQPSKA